MTRRGRLAMDGNWQPASVHIECCHLVAAAFDVPIERLLSKQRFKEIAEARQAAMYVLRRRFTLSYPQIALICGGFDHSTVIHANRAVQIRIDRDPTLAALIRQLVSGRRPKHYNGHVIAFDNRRTAELARFGSEAAMEAETTFVQRQRNVKPKNRLSPDDSDGLMRSKGSQALSAAIAAAGGWPDERD